MRKVELKRNGCGRVMMPGADLYGADLRGADLRGANLQGANLVNASLRGADLCRADLYRAKIEGAKFEGANFKDQIAFPEAWDAIRMCLRKDKELAEGYIANVGMVLFDHFSEGGDFSCPKTRDHAAKMILGHMFDIDFEKTSLEELKKHRR